MRRLESMVGMRFGKLTVERQDVALFKGKRQSVCYCLCDCGNRIEVPASKLKSGYHKSCGCSREIGDISGEKFGRLTAIRRVGTNENGEAIWLCRCDCGNEKIVSAYMLKNGSVSSCGCLAIESARENLKKALKNSFSDDAIKKRVKTYFGESGSESRRKKRKELLDGLYENYVLVDGANIGKISGDKPEGNNPYRGVCWSKRKKYWVAYCRVKGMKWQKHGFKTPEDAKKARDKKQLELIEIADIENAMEKRKELKGKQ